MTREDVRKWFDLATLGAAIGRFESDDFNRLGGMASRLRAVPVLGGGVKNSNLNPCARLRHVAVCASILCSEDRRAEIGALAGRVLGLCANEGVRQ